MALFVVHEKRNVEDINYVSANELPIRWHMSEMRSKIHCGRKYQIYNFVKHCIRYYLTNWNEHTSGTLREALNYAVNPLSRTIKETSTVSLYSTLTFSTLSLYNILPHHHYIHHKIELFQHWSYFIHYLHCQYSCYSRYTIQDTMLQRLRHI